MVWVSGFSGSEDEDKVVQYFQGVGKEAYMVKGSGFKEGGNMGQGIGNTGETFQTEKVQRQKNMWFRVPERR